MIMNEEINYTQDFPALSSEEHHHATPSYSTRKCAIKELSYSQKVKNSFKPSDFQFRSADSRKIKGQEKKEINIVKEVTKHEMVKVENEHLKKSVGTQVSDETLMVEKKAKRKRKKKSKPSNEGKITLLDAEKHKVFINGSEVQSAEKSLHSFQANLLDNEEYPVLSSSALLTKRSVSSTNWNSEKSHSSGIKVGSVKIETPSTAGEGVLQNKKSVSNIASKDNKSSKKTGKPLELNIMDILKKAKEIQMKSPFKPEHVAVKREKVPSKSDKSSPHNMLDSTAPIRKRGKEREKPKKAKITPLKKVILSERRIRKAQNNATQTLDVKLKENDSHTSEAEFSCENKFIVKSEVNDMVDEVNQELLEYDYELEQITEALNETNIHQNEPCFQTVNEEAKETKIEAEEIILNDLSELDVQSKTSDSTTEDMNIFAEPKINANEFDVSLPAVASIIDADTIKHCVNIILHNRKYRDYCNQLLSAEIDDLMQKLLSNLVRFQDRAYHKDPVKAKMKKRMVSGLREVTKYVKSRKVKFLIFAPDVEKIDSEGGLTDTLKNLMKLCNENNIEIVFGLPRRRLGHICKKHVPLSCIAILNYDGTEEEYKQMKELVVEAREGYLKLVKSIENKLTPQLIEALKKSLPSDQNIEAIRKKFWLENFSQIDAKVYTLINVKLENENLDT